jgi:CelD/BcsL family acetyltransferase involved in cellulose biosynthesis
MNRTVQRWPDLEAARPEWESLAGATGSVFSTPEWAAAWWRHHGSGHEAHLIGVSDDRGRLLAPLCRTRQRGARVLRLVGYGPADQLRPLGDLRLVPDLFDQLAADADWDAIRWDLVPAAVAVPSRLTKVEEESSPVLTTAGRTWEEYLAACSPNLRGQVGQRERRLRRRGTVQFQLTVDPARLEADLDVLFSLHRARWPRSEFGRLEAFHRDFAAVAMERGWLRLWRCEVDGSPVAAWYGFRYGGTEAYYQAGRDPAWERDAVGFVLLAHTIREALTDGVEAYRFLRGGEAYKWRFADADERLTTWVGHRSGAGRLAVATWRAAASARAVGGGARRRLRRQRAGVAPTSGARTTRGVEPPG